MNKFKKFALTLITAAGISCLGAAALCACAGGEPDYYKLTFKGSGVDYVMQGELKDFISGGKVKDGVEVQFTLVVGSSSVGTPDVLVNGSVITPDENGVYSFVITKESEVTVSGVNVLYNVSFSKSETVVNEDGQSVTSERRITYYNAQGEEVTEDKAVGGADYKFKIKPSVYYVNDYEVYANDALLTPEGETPDGGKLYTASITGDTLINVVGLEQELGFADRPGCGSGTKNDPYLLSRPVDLFYLAALTNSEWFASSGYYAAYYKLVSDINMQGEQLYVVGDNSINTAIFCGEFDGGNHTISNFYITDEVVDQESFANEYLTYVGLFGFAAAQDKKPAVIKDLKLENGELRMHTAAAKQSGQAGGLLLGYGIGVQVENCSVSGKISAVSDSTYFAYTGGVAGIMQSAYNDGVTPVVSYDAYVKDSSSTVTIDAIGGVYAAGGVVGYTISADYSAISYVTGCTSGGAINGGMNAGGIVGYAGMATSVTNCKSSADVRANNPLLNNSVNDKEYFYAYAGGVVGYTEDDAIVAYSYGTGSKVLAVAASGEEFAFSGAIAGSPEALVKGCGTSGNLTNNSSVTVTVGGKNYACSAIAPMAAWYKGANGSALPEFAENASGRSWGYFFDEALKEKVPSGFVPTQNITLYCGYADYSAIAGEYYVAANDISSGAHFNLADNGVMTFRHGARNMTCRYTCDGEGNVTVSECPLVLLSYTDEELGGAFTTFTGKINGDVLTLSGEVRTVSYSNVGTPSYTTEQVSYSAVKEEEGFTYGRYEEGIATYYFNKDGSALYERGGSSIVFSYTVSGNELTMESAAGDLWEGVVQGGVVKTVNGGALTFVSSGEESDDSFVGVWSFPGVRESIELTFGPTSAHGGEYGSVKIACAGGVILTLNAEYDVQNTGSAKLVRIFLGGLQYGELEYKKDGTLSGIFYSNHYGAYYANVSFYKYDAFKGTWKAAGQDISQLNFNGKGLYDVPAKPQTAEMQAVMEVRGAFTAVTASSEIVKGSYLIDKNGVCEISAGGKTYIAQVTGDTLVLTDKDDSANKITFTR